ncbi:MAG TPA: ankyrin repeat domain-containing protein [Candidatus Ozemobacteraceae bacterium]|nr:ankyrin repeat domain-containing protein [Candidatus Ozemobacteraceae bacterium]
MERRQKALPLRPRRGATCVTLAFRLFLVVLLLSAWGVAWVPVWFPVHTHLHPLLAARLLINKRGINDVDAKQYTPLQTAAEQGCPACTRLLLSARPDLEKQLPPSSHTGYRALHLAATSGNIEVTQLLASAGADLNGTDSTGCTPVFWAIRRGHEGLVAHLLALGADPNHRSGWGWRPLHWAALLGKELAVQELLDAGASINERICAQFTITRFEKPRADGAIGLLEVQTWPDSLGTTTPISWTTHLTNPCGHPDPLARSVNAEEDDKPRLYTPLGLSRVFRYDAVTALLQAKGGTE